MFKNVENMRLRFIFFFCAVLLLSAHVQGQSYHAGDVAVINKMIAGNGLRATANSPSSWARFLTWELIGNSFRITNMAFIREGLSGDLDLSELAELQNLNIDAESLTKLNVSGITKLYALNCGANQLTSLNVKGCTDLQTIYCDRNQLASLDVSGLQKLERLGCTQNKMTSLNVSGCTNLKILECQINQLTSLDMSGLPKLEAIECGNNLLTSINLKGSQLGYLYCEDNPLTSLDFSGLTNKNISLRCYNTPLTKLVYIDGTTLNVAASPPSGGAVSIVGASTGNASVRAAANKDYTFYDWTISVEGGESQNFAQPSSFSFKISGGGVFTVIANFAGGPANVPVSSITLDKTSLNLNEGETYSLKATIAPANATNQAVTWKSGNEGVATVTAAGAVKGTGAGTTAITATADGKTATCNVTVTAANKPEFEVVNGVLVKYHGRGGAVVIPANLGITAIGYQAFLECTTLTSVEIPKGVTRIETSAFNSCINLTSVKLPDGLVTIDDRAFYKCSSLTAIDLPKSVKAIGQWAFFQCTSLRNVTAHWDKASDIPDVNAFYAADVANTALHVPAGMKPDYQSAYGWGYFGSYPYEAGNGGNGNNNENGNENMKEMITLNHWSWWLHPNETLVLSASVTSESVQSLTWKSDNPEIATVNGSGLNVTVRAVAEGNTVIRVSTALGAMNYCSINVAESNNITAYAPNMPEGNRMIVGEKFQCTIPFGPENVSFTYTLTSSNPSVASISSDGLITAIAVGTTTIDGEAKYESGFSMNGGFRISVINNADNDKYNSSDIGALKKFVSQQDNYQKLGLDKDWEKDTKWHEKVKGVKWTYNRDNEEMGITEIDWNYYNITGRLDATGFSALGTLKVSYTNLTEINVNGMESLNHLACSHIGLLRYLDVSNNPNLRYLFCSGNIFSFSTVPPTNSKYTIYNYAPQLTINVPASPGKEVDMTDYLYYNGTVFNWYRSGNLSARLTDIVEKGTKGKFFIPAGYADTELVCIITNSYYPDFTGDNAMRCRVQVGSNADAAVVAEQKPETDPEKKSVDVRFDVPSDVTAVNGEMKINVPGGIRLDRPGLEEYMKKGNMTMNLIEETTNAFSSNWFLRFFFEMLPSYSSSMLRSNGQSSLQINIPFIIDRQLPDGNYPVTISNVKLDFDNGTKYVEPELPVTLTVDRSSTGISRIAETDVHVYAQGNHLYISSPVAETVSVYSITGALVVHATKPSGVIRIPVNERKGQIVIVRGSSGWVKKAFMN